MSTNTTVNISAPFSSFPRLFSVFFFFFFCCCAAAFLERRYLLLSLFAASFIKKKKKFMSPSSQVRLGWLGEGDGHKLSFFFLPRHKNGHHHPHCIAGRLCSEQSKQTLLRIHPCPPLVAPIGWTLSQSAIQSTLQSVILKASQSVSWSVSQVDRWAGRVAKRKKEEGDAVKRCSKVVLCLHIRRAHDL